MAELSNNKVSFPGTSKASSGIASKTFSGNTPQSVNFGFVNETPASIDGFTTDRIICFAAVSDANEAPSVFAFTKEGYVVKICGNGTLTYNGTTKLFTLSAANSNAWGVFTIYGEAEVLSYIGKA